MIIDTFFDIFAQEFNSFLDILCIILLSKMLANQQRLHQLLKNKNPSNK